MAVKIVKEKIKYPVYSKKYYLYCDKCGALMYRDNVTLTTWPAQYIYFCPDCGHTETSFTLNDNAMRSYNDWYKTHKNN